MISLLQIDGPQIVDHEDRLLVLYQVSIFLTVTEILQVLKKDVKIGVIGHVVQRYAKTNEDRARNLGQDSVKFLLTLAFHNMLHLKPKKMKGKYLLREWK